jgi:phosphotransferase system HPr-like phosphotransfer protein
MKVFDDVDRPNGNVRKDDVGQVDAAFKEAMVARDLSFEDGRMHPLLHDMCQAIQAELGPGIRHPRLRNKFALLLAYRLAEALKKLQSSIYLKDKTHSQKKGIESVMNVRAYTYVAVLLGLSTQKKATGKSEYEIFKQNLDSGNSKMQLSTAFNSYGAQGLLVLANLKQRLRATPRRGMDTELLAPCTIGLHVRSASTLLRMAQKLFAPESGQLADWIGHQAREELVVAEAVASVQPNQTNADNDDPQTQLKHSRKRFNSCLPHLRASVAAGIETAVMPSTGSPAQSQDSLLDPEVITFLSTISTDTSQSQSDDFDVDEWLSFTDAPHSDHKRKADQAFSDSP